VLAKITVMSLCETVDDRMSDDKKLCPIRALRHYLGRTHQHRGTNKQPFISTMAPYQGVTTSTLSRWIWTTVRICYAHSTNGDRAHAQIRAHDRRGFATTWAFKNSVPLLEVLKAGPWKKHTTFTDFYLKDLTSLQNGLRSLGTLSVAQHKVLSTFLICTSTSVRAPALGEGFYLYDRRWMYIEAQKTNVERYLHPYTQLTEFV
jgi:hypothetical protein